MPCVSGSEGGKQLLRSMRLPPCLWLCVRVCVIVCVCISFIFFCPLSSFPFIPPFPVPVFVSFLFFCVFPSALLFRLLYFNRWLWCSKTEKGYTWAVVSFFRSFLVESSISCLDPPPKKPKIKDLGSPLTPLHALLFNAPSHPGQLTHLILKPNSLPRLALSPLSPLSPPLCYFARRAKIIKPCALCRA